MDTRKKCRVCSVEVNDNEFTWFNIRGKDNTRLTGLMLPKGSHICDDCGPMFENAMIDKG